MGHYLGMDTHDTHLVSRGLGLHPGMVITVEPGIYISEDNKNVPERFVIWSQLNTTVVAIHLRFRDLMNDCRPRTLFSLERRFAVDQKVATLAMILHRIT